MVTVVPYALLGVLVAVTVVEKRADGAGLVVDLGLCALAAAWMLIVLRPAWRERPRVMVVFFTVLMAIMAVLVVRDPWFGFFVPAAYVYAFRLLPWPGRLAGVGAVAVLAGTAQAAGLLRPTLFGAAVYVALLLANVIPMCGFAWFAWRAGQRNDEIRETNRRLEASLAENAELHERLLDQARETGIRDERERMAREIHDTLAQGLTGIIAQLQAAEQPGDDDPQAWRRHVTTATQLARESLVEARRSVHALRPEPLETARLGAALAAVADRWSTRHGVPVQVTTTGTARPMRPDVEAALLRTAQEALANVARHARATRVGVTLSYMDHEVTLDIRDDGTGFALGPHGGGARPGSALDARQAGGGYGLVGMRERIEGLSGRLLIESEPGAGTGISACVPVEATA